MSKSFIFYIYILLLGVLLCSCGAKKHTLKSNTTEKSQIERSDSTDMSIQKEERAEERAEEVVFEVTTTETEQDTTAQGAQRTKTTTYKKTIRRGEAQKTTSTTETAQKTTSTTETAQKTTSTTEKKRERDTNPCFLLHSLALLLGVLLVLVVAIGKRKKKL